MKKLILLIAMMLAIAGVVAQGVDFTVNKALKKDYFKVQISIISGSDICAGSASGIHTPPLSWHPFQKGTLPP